MFVRDFKKIIDVEFTGFRRGFFQHEIRQCVPPIFVVVFARAIDRLASRHLFPGGIEGSVQFLRIQFQTDLMAHARIMFAHRACQIKKGAHSVQKDGLDGLVLDHSSSGPENAGRSAGCLAVELAQQFRGSKVQPMQARRLRSRNFVHTQHSCATFPRMLPVEHNDPINEKILAISEDKIAGFVREPFQQIAERSGVNVDVVMARIGAMLRAGTIRRVRQTLLATNLADGALVAWKVSEEKIDAAFDFMFRRDPFSGHVVLRSTDTLTAGSDYKLWTTVKVPHGFSLEKHCRLLAGKAGAERFRIMPATGIFTLGVGHVRRKTIEPGSRAASPAKMIEVRAVELSEREWKVLLALKREFVPEEIRPTPWASRANESGVSLEEFYRVAEELNAHKIIGRFSTFLEHVKPSAGGVRVTRFNARV